MGTANFSLGEGRSASDPLYNRIERMLLREIEAGNLSEGDRLPSVRALAKELKVNAVTVSRAYRELSKRGILKGRGRGGTVVASTSTQHRQRNAPNVESQLPDTHKSRSVLGNRAFQQMLAASQSEHLIQLTKAYPSSDIIWTDGLRKTLRDVSKHAGPEMFEYSASCGSAALRNAIASYLAEQNTDAGADEIIVTSGAQQGLDIVTRTLFRDGDTIIMERPTYFGMLDLLRTSGINAVTVEMLEDGVSPDQLEEAIRTHKPKAFYTMPTFHNPAGVTQSLERRNQVVEICARHGVSVIEDDYAPELRFSGEPLPSLWTIARDKGGDCRVFYVRGFSKTYLPGIRLGFVLVPKSDYEDVLSSRGLSTLHSSNLVQMFGTEFFQSGQWREVGQRLVDTYKSRQALLRDQLRSNLPREVDIVVPEGGLNFWLKLPGHVDAGEMFFAAIRNGVSYFSGELFYADRPELNTMRISFGSLEETEIPKAAMRLGDTVSQQLVARNNPVSMIL